MPYLVAAVVLVGLLCIADLLLTFGVVRRLREHTELLAKLSAGRSEPQVLAVGTTIGDFRATTTSGGTLSSGDIEETTLVGFFSTGCEACHERLPAFLDTAREMEGGRRRALAVVVTTEEGDGVETVSALEPVARVVVESPYGPLAGAFGVDTFPVFYLIDETRSVAASGFDLEALAVGG